jgi:3-deoxy-7-phosphoheptulonate synthase
VEKIVIVVMQPYPAQSEIDAVVERLHAAGLSAYLSGGRERTVIGGTGSSNQPGLSETVERLPGVERVAAISRPYKLASREFRSESTVVQVGDVRIGADGFVVMAGPCSVESRDQLLTTAESVKAAGAQLLRGGAYKPRTSPYSFQGLGPDGLELLAEARDATGLPIVTEVMEPGDVELVASYADLLQVGARNMQNFPLLRAVGRSRRPVLLKRALSGTIEEWLTAAEYILAAGNDRVILCERGIRTFETAARNTLDLSAVPIVKRLSHLPVLADPSHGTGKWYLVKPLAQAALAVGADGLIVEVHPSPDQALSDGPQSLTLANFSTMMDGLRQIAPAVDRVMLPARRPIGAL